MIHKSHHLVGTSAPILEWAIKGELYNRLEVWSWRSADQWPKYNTIDAWGFWDAYCLYVPFSGCVMSHIVCLQMEKILPKASSYKLIIIVVNKARVKCFHGINYPPSTASPSLSPCTYNIWMAVSLSLWLATNYPLHRNCATMRYLLKSGTLKAPDDNLFQ